MKNKTLTRIAVSSLITACLMVQPCYAAEATAETQTTEESDHHPEPAPDETATVQEGQGTLSPPSESEGGSVFGSSASSETAGTDEKLQSVLSSLALPSGNGTWKNFPTLKRARFWMTWRKIPKEPSRMPECRQQV